MKYRSFKSFAAALLAFVALAAGQEAMAVEKTVTYTFTAERVGASNSYKLTFTPAGDQFGTSTGAKTVTISNVTNTTGFSVQLDDGVQLRFIKSAGQMTFGGFHSIFLSPADNPRFEVVCSDYYIRHVTLANKDGNALNGTLTMPVHYIGALDVDVDIDKSDDTTSNAFYVSSISGSTTFCSITLTLGDFAPGGGTEADPYTIRYASQLDLLATRVNGGETFAGAHFVLANDIAYSYTTAWNDAKSTENNYTAIGTGTGKLFHGIFDGQGHTVSGIRIYKSGTTNADNRQGLFGAVYNGGTVKRVNLANARITGCNYVGGIAGVTSEATVEDCTVSTDVCIHTSASSATHHGGIVGYNNSSTVRKCISSATLTVEGGGSSRRYFGGIAGENDRANARSTISDCIALGVVIPGVTNHGAIVGGNTRGTLTRNFYRDCKVASNVVTPSGVGLGIDLSITTSDADGVQPLFSLTLESGITAADRTASATLPGTGNATYTNGADIAGTAYYAPSSTLRLSYDSSTLPGGHTLVVTATETSGGAPVTIIDNGDYTYDLTMPAKDVTVTASLIYTDISLTAHEATYAGQTRYWATFYHPTYNYQLPAGAQAFTMKSDKALYRVGDGSVIPADCAVVIMADSADLMLTVTRNGATPQSGNILRGTSSPLAIDGAVVSARVLSKLGSFFGFFQFNSTIPANKAYYVEE